MRFMRDDALDDDDEPDEEPEEPAAPSPLGYSFSAFLRASASTPSFLVKALSMVSALDSS